MILDLTILTTRYHPVLLLLPIRREHIYCTYLKAMEHLLGSFVPPPLLLVLVSSLHLLLLKQKHCRTYKH